MGRSSHLGSQYHLAEQLQQEIQQMILFFRTAAGQKYLRYSPLLQEETVTIGQRIAHEQQPKLLEMLQQARQNSSSSH